VISLPTFEKARLGRAIGSRSGRLVRPVAHRARHASSQGNGGVDAGFLSTIDAAVRGDRRGEAGAPDPANVQALLEGPAAREGEHTASIEVDKFGRRRRERERAARLEELGRRNAQAWQARHRVRPRVQAGPRRDRLQAPWRHLLVGPMWELAKG
jgi:hypothetical protein